MARPRSRRLPRQDSYGHHLPCRALAGRIQPSGLPGSACPGILACVQRPAGHFPCMGPLGSPVPRSCAARSAVMSGALRVMVWAVLAGLFLMHGAAASAGSCQGSALLTAMSVTAAMPVTTPAGAVSGTSHPAAASAFAWVAAAPAGHARGAASGASTAAASPAGDDCSGMHCAARLPRDVASTGSGIPSAAAVLYVAGPARSCSSAVTWRASRPPGRPGLPLPLFLGVSRT